MGPVTYDLVSFLLDRRSAPPSLAELRAYRLFLLEERRLLGLEALDPDECDPSLNASAPAIIDLAPDNALTNT